MNVKTQDQTFLKGMHSGEITTLGFNPARNLVATAQNSISDRMDQPYFVIWQLLASDEHEGSSL